MSFGIYIHVPFCRRRCRYCDFYLTTNTKLTEDFTASLEEEIRLFAEANGRLNVDSVFFGGGTPSMLGMNQLNGIMDALHRNFDVSSDSEITLECNPEDISADDVKLKGFKEAGVNRLSIGAQSFDENELKFLTRAHTPSDSRQSVINALKFFDNVSVDIIYSIPGQTEAALISNLEVLVTLGVPHVSAYTLIFEKGTLLYNDMSKKKVVQNSDAAESVLYHAANDFLVSKGFNHYEVSNYAGKGFESRHNLKYWNFGEYIGLGPSAHSFFGGIRWNNVRSVSGYVKIISGGNLPAENIETQTPDRMKTDYFICTLRSKGVDIAGFRKMFNSDFEMEYRKEIQNNLLTGNAVIENGYFRLTDKGFALADSITLEFLK